MSKERTGNKKIKIVLLILLIVALLGVAVVLILFGMQKANTKVVERYELAHYSGGEVNTQGAEIYNEELFYTNEYEFGMADVFVLDNTERDGYYYLYGTGSKIFETFRSKDLDDWEPMGFIFDDLQRETEEMKVLDDRLWAPEVVYDEDLDKYILFLSACPDLEYETYEAGKGIIDSYNTRYILFAMMSDSPCGPFQLIDFTDSQMVGEENVHHYNQTAGIKTTADDPYAVEDAGSYYKAAFPQYWGKYLYFNPETYYEKLIDCVNIDIEELKTSRSGMYITIDAHPFVDDNGDKYLYFVISGGIGRIAVVKMENWLKPDWDTFDVVIRHGYWTVEDALKADAGEDIETVPFEEEGVHINEGPCMVKHNGKYYMTLSCNTYRYQSYMVLQAVSDNPLGPFRKLTEAEGGILISADFGTMTQVSGTGHHSMIERDGKLYAIYHKHYSVELAGGGRQPAMDEVQWVTITDKNGEELDVMYCVPSVSIQPLPEFAAKYKNIASDANISLSTGKLEAGSSLEYLTDGLLSAYRSVNYEFVEKYVKETRIKDDCTITMDFDEAKTVRAIMLYNSKNNENVFTEIKDITIYATDGKIYYMKDIPCHGIEILQYDYVAEYTSLPSVAAYAEFDEIEVEKITISVDLPQGVDCVGLSELRVLGK